MSEGTDGPGAILTLEPFIEGVRDGAEGSGWRLSGLQKTTSHEFEGRWAGESTRSAYLFFHRADLPDEISVEAFLDETSRGLRGNLSLVVEGPELGELPSFPELLRHLSTAVRASLPEGYRTPITLRAGLDDAESPSGSAEVQLRVKLRFPRTAMEAGRSAVSALTSATVAAFETLLARSELHAFLSDGGGGGDGR
ncbi:MAG: hypothetical protein EA422_09565 [Gemmatimonadales bacterium]|nr:MAG: hypothetical protein EA422_09565 [Gemmatimonadales bacterium]